MRKWPEAACHVKPVYLSHPASAVTIGILITINIFVVPTVAVKCIATLIGISF